MKQNILAIIGAALAIVLLAACSEDSQNNTEQNEIDVQELKQLVHDHGVKNIENQVASITDQELIVTHSDETQTVYTLPEDEFFVSIAPYINETHPCTFHNLTGCQGEMTEEEFQIYIEDTDGNVVMNDTVTSLENGFIDFWLPSDNTYHITIAYDTMTVEAEFSTFEGDATCITTMQLS
ncbi:CueP family metal-binding protein [Evansella tamaricis]|uniref:CueP family metal-binding protein n=1 Tax=Evansella tamaricis TaxID=2069301 RepID=A0ABS6JL33_9BACI|nr:CueP family metal-binding protein [Evansella tamaricis]MBU9714385.1 CueP family metal-binding protein [Evansella tamaricis]